MKVRDVCTPNVERILPTTTVREAAGKMKELNVGVMPVYEGDRLIGMVTDRDIAIRAIAEGKDPSQCAVRDVMSPGIVYCFDDQDIREAAKLMREKQVRRLIVLNHDKRLVGIVSLGDLAVEAPDKLAGAALKGISTPSEPARPAAH
jgi:CBS domain-containing protein